MLYAELKKSLYGILQAALIFWGNLTSNLLLSIAVHLGSRYKVVTNLCAIRLSSYRLRTHVHVYVHVMVARDLYCLRAGAVYV